MSIIKSPRIIILVAVVIALIIGLYSCTVKPVSIYYCVQNAVIGGLLGGVIGFVLWIINREDSSIVDDQNSDLRTTDRRRHVTKSTYNITQGNEVILLDYMGVAKSKAKFLPVVVIFIMMGGCVPFIKHDAPGEYFVFCIVLAIFLYYALQPTFSTLKIVPGKVIEGDFGRIGFQYISNISYNTHNEVYAVVSGAELLLTSRLKTSSLAMEISSKLNYFLGR